MQSINPYENAFVHKEILTLINHNSLHQEDIKNYLKTTFQYIPNDDNHRTLVIKSDLYFLGIADNIFVCFPLTVPTVDSVHFLTMLSEIISLMIKKKYTSPHLANFVSCKLCCYIPIDKKTPFGFIKQYDGVLTTDIFGSALHQPNLTLHTKTFQFDKDYNLLTLSVENIIESFITKNQSQPTLFPQQQSQPTLFPQQQSQPTLFPQHQSQPTLFPQQQSLFQNKVYSFGK